MKALARRIKRRLVWYASAMRDGSSIVAEYEDAASEFPNYLSVAFTSICNSRCVFCPSRLNPSPGVIDDDLLAFVAEEYGKIGGRHIGISLGIGDPLADPRFWEHLAIVNRVPKVQAQVMVSNLIGARALGPERIALEGPERLMVSIGGFERQSYRAVFGVDAFDQVRESLLTILRTRRNAGKPLDITVYCRTTGSVRHIPGLTFYKELREFLPQGRVQYHSHGFDNWGGMITQKDLLPGMKMIKDVRKPYPCLHLYADLGVHVDGTAVACVCREPFGKSDLVVGHVRTHSLRELGHNVAKLRQAWAEGKVPHLCRHCTSYVNLPRTVLDGSMLRELRVRKQLMHPGEGKG